MKKFLLLFVVLFGTFVLTVSLSNCGGGDNGGSSGNTGGGNVTLVGKWYIGSIEFYEFQAGGKFNMAEGAFTYDYYVSGDTIHTNIAGVLPGTVKYSITNRTLTLTNSSKDCILIDGTYTRP